MKSTLNSTSESATAAIFLSAVLFCFAPVCSGEESSNKRTGEDIYKQFCSSCHVAGGNTAKPSKPIAGSKVLKSIATFQEYLENPPGHMPYYKTVVNDKSMVRKLYEYCKKLKQTQGA
ncbi:MAG TPA: cytochrome c [Candidatus Melainabacteria bacterium]|nr:cytochrome c [Candidatus Melainabacteria bacterium]HIN63114.1 cytochrome c [Candidatus Obscuribacterales bacterium]